MSSNYSKSDFKGVKISLKVKHAIFPTKSKDQRLCFAQKKKTDKNQWHSNLSLSWHFMLHTQNAQ